VEATSTGNKSAGGKCTKMTGKPERNRPFVRPGCKWDIKMGHTEIGCVSFTWRALTSTVINLRNP
jgi:hypothetical protein